MRRHKKDVEGAHFKFGRIVRSPGGRRLWFLAVVVMVGCCAGFAVRAYSRRGSEAAPPPAFSHSTAIQATGRSRTQLDASLTLQPEADRMRRRLGQRFQAPGLEVSSMSGLLTVGGDQKPVRITRTQDEEGEQVAVSLGAAQTRFSWSGTEGVTSSGKPAQAPDRSLIERLVFDSAEEFIEGQLRMASYYTVARRAMPGAARGSDDYDGPVWDLVRITEPSKTAGEKPLSPSRLYYINSSTGLIDKVVSDELGQTTVAELSGWVNQGGEMVATRIVWTQNKKVVMELLLNSVSHGPRQ